MEHTCEFKGNQVCKDQAQAEAASDQTSTARTANASRHDVLRRGDDQQTCARHAPFVAAVVVLERPILHASNILSPIHGNRLKLH